MSTTTLAPAAAPDPSGQSLRDAILDRLWTVHAFTPLSEDDHLHLMQLHGAIDMLIDGQAVYFPSRSI